MLKVQLPVAMSLHTLVSAAGGTVLMMMPQPPTLCPVADVAVLLWHLTAALHGMAQVLLVRRTQAVSGCPLLQSG